MRKDRKDDQNRWLPTPDEIFGDITVGPHQFLEHRKFKDVDCRARCCASLAMVSKCFSKMQSSKSTPMMGPSHTTPILRVREACVNHQRPINSMALDSGTVWQTQLLGLGQKN